MDITAVCIVAVLAIVILAVLFLLLAGEEPYGIYPPKKIGACRKTDIHATAQRKEVLRIENLTVFRGKKRVLDKVDLNIFEGEKIAIIGPSAAGKSTLASCIRGELIPAEDGTIVFDGAPLQYDGIALSQHYVNVPVIDQAASSLVPFHSVYKNIVKQLLVNGLTQAQAGNEAHKWIKMMELEQKAHSLPEQLSGGEKQRSVIAKALAMGGTVKLLLADEPTSSLDPPLAQGIVKSLIKEARFAVIFITHQIELVLNDVDRILLLYQGKFTDVTIIKRRNPRYFTELLEACEPHMYYPELLKEVTRLQEQEKWERECLDNVGDGLGPYAKRNVVVSCDSPLTLTTFTRRLK